MNTRTLGVVIAVFAALGAGYWAGKARVGAGGTAATTPVTSGQVADAGLKPPRKLLYYRNPMGLPDTSPVPKKDSMGMDYIQVYEEIGRAHV